VCGAPDFFGQCQRRASIPIRHANERGARIVIQRQGFGFRLFGARQQFCDSVFVERAKRHHAGAREQRGVEFERWILGRGADQGDGSVFHHGQKGILLRAIEAMDFIDKQQGRAADGASLAGLLKYFLQIRDAAENGGDLHEVEIGLPCKKSCDSGLSRSRRTPEDKRAHGAGANQSRQRAVCAKQMILPRNIAKLHGAQAISERSRRVVLKACC